MESTRPNMRCPICGSDMQNRSLFTHYSFKPYWVCPDCNGKYTTDSDSKIRAIVIVILAILTLGYSITVSIQGSVWLLPAAISMIILWIYLGYAISKIQYVQYRD